MSDENTVPFSRIVLYLYISFMSDEKMIPFSHTVLYCTCICTAYSTVALMSDEKTVPFFRIVLYIHININKNDMLCLCGIFFWSL